MSAFNAPNIITLSRIGLIPWVILSHYWGYPMVSFILFIITVLSDLADGIAARRLNQQTDLGALLDPIADRILSITLYSYVAWFALAPVWLCAIVLLRNIAQILSIPILLVWFKRTFKVEPNQLSKWGTVLSDIFLFLPLFAQGILISNPMNSLIIFMIAIAIVECLILAQYLPQLITIAIGTNDTFR